MPYIASRPQYEAHLRPIIDSLPGDFDDQYEGVTLVASYHDLTVARRQGARRIVLMQHGAGQSYGGDPRSAHNPAYPGGNDNDDVGLFLVPNAHAADRWRARYPGARVDVVGSPRLDVLPRHQANPTEGPVVALTFHWTPMLSPEAGSAFAHVRRVLPDLARRFRLLGHGHPRRTDLPRIYRSLGIEYEPDFDEVCRRADVLVFDNTSAGFEFAATGRPVVVMDAPTYRTGVHHGLRFWEAADVGVRTSVPDVLAPSIERALERRPEDVAARERALDIVYAYRTGAAQRAADAITAWA